MVAWRSQPGMLGLRLTFNRTPSLQWLTDGTAEWLWAEAEASTIPIMVFPPGQLNAIERIASEHPSLPLIIDHAAVPARGAQGSFQDIIDAVCALARLPNVSVKASALPGIIPELFPFPTASKIAQRLVDSFGPERVFWGSDFTRVSCTYKEGATYLADSGCFSDTELEWLMGKGLSKILRWPRLTIDT